MQSGIMPRHTPYKSEANFIDHYKGVSIGVSEIKLTKQSRKSKVTVFNGLALLLSGEIKPFNGHTIITKDKTKDCQSQRQIRGEVRQERGTFQRSR